MQSDLFKQLEDKKKELIEIEKEYGNCEEAIILKAEIAILEQAIAEMQKQRQEILDKIQEVKEILINKGFDHQHSEDCFICECIDKLEQLNQPKTEHENQHI